LGAVDSCRKSLVYNMPNEPVEVEMQCPVCASQAKNLTPNTLDGVVIGCDHCGEYRIASGAYYALTTLKPDLRVAALATAKRASKAGWPLINGSCIRTS
jgi:hypothetical protein